MADYQITQYFVGKRRAWNHDVWAGPFYDRSQVDDRLREMDPIGAQELEIVKVVLPVEKV